MLVANPSKSVRQGSGIRGSRHRSEWPGEELMEENPQLSAGEMENQACRCWSANQVQEGGQFRRFPGKGFYDWAFK